MILNKEDLPYSYRSRTRGGMVPFLHVVWDVYYENTVIRTCGYKSDASELTHLLNTAYSLGHADGARAERIKFNPSTSTYLNRVEVIRVYNPQYGDDRVCKCGHTYYRHFDPYEDMEAVGCKYCMCGTFTERITNGASSSDCCNSGTNHAVDSPYLLAQEDHNLRTDRDDGGHIPDHNSGVL